MIPGGVRSRRGNAGAPRGGRSRCPHRVRRSHRLAGRRAPGSKCGFVVHSNIPFSTIPRGSRPPVSVAPRISTHAGTAAARSGRVAEGRRQGRTVWRSRSGGGSPCRRHCPSRRRCRSAVRSSCVRRAAPWGRSIGGGSRSTARRRHRRANTTGRRAVRGGRCVNSTCRPASLPGSFRTSLRQRHCRTERRCPMPGNRGANSTAMPTTPG